MTFQLEQPITRDAALSQCGLYRWWLSRIWEPKGTVCAWIMLNPSTADHRQDDPTIRRCIDFAKRWGHGSIYVVNLFALRASDPKSMLAAKAPIGDANDAFIIEHCLGAHQVIAAWGVLGGHLSRNQYIMEWARRAEIYIECLGTTNGGHPRHPLYVRSNVKPQRFHMPRRK